MDKAIKSGKEKRRQWNDSRDIDGSCRNHHGCPWCEGNRLYQQRKQEIEAMQERLRPLVPSVDEYLKEKRDASAAE